MTTPSDVSRLLREQLGIDADEVSLIGAGAWSQCFGFRSPDGEFVIRLGQFVDDFERDRLAYRYNSVDLPVPEVIAIGKALGGHYAVSTRVHGSPLETCTVDEWTAVAPSVLRMLSALRDASPIGTGFGMWDVSGNAEFSTWREFLLAIGGDEPHHRIAGWSHKLRTSAGGNAAFVRYLQQLDEVAVDDVPRSLVHSDLINRNVHVRGSQVTGVFDWGCSLYGDHLFDLSWFEFWSPWHPDLDLTPLLATLSSALGANLERRRLACLLYIGLAHIVYNAHLEDWSSVADVERRLAQLC